MSDVPLTFVRGETPEGDAIISLLLLQQFAVASNGQCELIGDAQPRQQVSYYPEEASNAKVQASLVERDSDLYAWRRHTDVVVQGTVRSQTPCQTVAVTLACAGHVRGSWTITATGDRYLDKRGDKWHLSEPASFTEMPLRYDRAYGGTDMHAERELANPDEEAMFALMFTELENRQFGTFSYPRNPAGLGYATTAESLAGLRWPNLEWQDTPLLLDERLVLEHGRWGERPSPAGFDWYPHAWFPRIAFFGDFAATSGNTTPQLEVDMGLLPTQLRGMTLLERPKHGFAQGAHPFLQGSRLQGDEQLTVNALGAEGQDLTLRLPGRTPRAHIVGPDGKQRSARSALDLVLWNCDTQRLELVWRITVPVQPHAAMAEDWRERCSANISWR